MYGIDDALLIGGLATSLAGTGMGIAGNMQAQDAMNSARSSEVQAEKQYENQANSVFQNSVSQQGAGTAKNEAAAGAAQRENAFNSLNQVAQPVVGAPLPTDTNSNPVVDTSGQTSPGNPVERANSLASSRGSAFNTLTSNAAATEGGLQDWQTQEAVRNAEANRQIAPIASEAQGRAALLPTELQVAGASGDELSGWGSLVGALGSTAATAGAVGMAAPGIPTGSPGVTGAPIMDLGPAMGAEAVSPFDYSNPNSWLPNSADNYLNSNPWGTFNFFPQSNRKQYQPIF